MTDAANLTMSEVLDNLCEQLWGPPHPDADFPRHWSGLPAKLAEELTEDEDLRNRMKELLVGVAAGLKGPPPPLTSYGWSDLPALAAQAIADNKELHHQLAHEKLRADQGWERYESANADRNALRAERAGMVAILDGVAASFPGDAGVAWANLPALWRARQRGYVMMATQLKTIREHASGFACWWGMTEAHQELAGKPIADSATVFHFMGSGASTAVQAHEIRRLLDTIYGRNGLATETEPEQIP